MKPLAQIEKEYVLLAFEFCEFSVSKTAKTLEIGRATLYRKLKSYGVDFDNVRKKIDTTKKGPQSPRGL